MAKRGTMWEYTYDSKRSSVISRLSKRISKAGGGLHNIPDAHGTTAASDGMQVVSVIDISDQSGVVIDLVPVPTTEGRSILMMIQVLISYQLMYESNVTK